MLVTFSSKDHGNIIMFGDMAQSLITMMGFTTKVPGAIRAEDVARALVNLEKNIELVQQQQISHQDKQQAIDDEDEKEPEIGIAVRAVPLIDLLKSAIAAKSYVMWE